VGGKEIKIDEEKEKDGKKRWREDLLRREYKSVDLQGESSRADSNNGTLSRRRDNAVPSDFAPTIAPTKTGRPS